MCVGAEFVSTQRLLVGVLPAAAVERVRLVRTGVMVGALFVEGVGGRISGGCGSLRG